MKEIWGIPITLAIFILWRTFVVIGEAREERRMQNMTKEEREKLEEYQKSLKEKGYSKIQKAIIAITVLVIIITAIVVIYSVLKYPSS